MGLFRLLYKILQNNQYSNSLQRFYKTVKLLTFWTTVKQRVNIGLSDPFDLILELLPWNINTSQLLNITVSICIRQSTLGCCNTLSTPSNYRSYHLLLYLQISLILSTGFNGPLIHYLDLPLRPRRLRSELEKDVIVPTTSLFTR